MVLRAKTAEKRKNRKFVKITFKSFLPFLGSQWRAWLRFGDSGERLENVAFWALQELLSRGAPHTPQIYLDREGIPVNTVAPLGEVDPWLQPGGLVFLQVSIGFRTCSTGFPWFFNGFPRLFNGFHWFCNGFHCFSMVFNEFAMVFIDFSMHFIVFHGFQWFCNGFHRFFKGFPMFCNGFHWFPMVFNGFSMVSLVFQWFSSAF